jgi:peptidoglycan/LPS O-acetylase OafA/YrhL
MAANVLLPGAAHSMFLGMIGALLLASPSIDWRRWDEPLRLGAIVCLAAVFGMRALDGKGERLFQMWGVPLVSLACTLFLVSILRGAPEADRLRSPALRFLGRLSYGIYLLHMPALGLMHGLILGGRPDIATPAQIAVTVAAVAATLGLAWLANVAIEQPMIECGRRWRFARAAGA